MKTSEDQQVSNTQDHHTFVTQHFLEWLGLEGTPGITKFQPPTTGKVTNLQIWY